MGYYSDPTASKALGSINREFSKLEKGQSSCASFMMRVSSLEKTLPKSRRSLRGFIATCLISPLKRKKVNKKSPLGFPRG